MMILSRVRMSFALPVLAIFLIAPSAMGGNIAGVVQELTLTPIEDVTIIVVDLATGETVGRSKSGPGGVYDVGLPEGVAVSVTFTHQSHLPASLIGISGSTILKDFPIFMPLPEATCPPVISYVQCPPYSYPRRSFGLFRRR